jgi:hypothetical protein
VGSTNRCARHAQGRAASSGTDTAGSLRIDSVLIPFDELARMANRTKPSAVKRWCQRQGIPWMPDADGRPTTSEIAYNEALMRGRPTRPKYQ